MVMWGNAAEKKYTDAGQVALSSQNFPCAKESLGQFC